MSYTAPTKDMLFNLEYIANVSSLAKYSKFTDAGLETADAVLGEAAKFAQEVLAPLNREGDEDPSSWRNGAVTATPGFKTAYEQFAHDGWQGLQHPTAYGGQGLPKAIAAAVNEMQNSANLSFALCPLLTDGAIEALLTAGSEDLKDLFLGKLISGEWTGTMNLTEAQAGSDLALIRTKAEKIEGEDGRYLISGTKIFITWGDHDMADNIIHLVLARVAEAPDGVKGLSLFVVPKFNLNARGQIEDRNDVKCVSIEHKLGIKASPTCVMQYGDHDEAGGYIVGEEGRGLEYMFIMMNAARFGVGVQGVAMSDRACQKAVAYARERIQCRPVDGSEPTSTTIIHHPDVRRMLMMMRGYTEGCRALYMLAAYHHDMAGVEENVEQKASHQSLYEFLVPLVKGFSTESSVQVTSLAIQVYGGMGFIEETGVAQHFRDARILPIYEGTTAIQANDLVGRKTLKDNGKAAKLLAEQIAQTERLLNELATEVSTVVASKLKAARQAFESVVGYVLHTCKENPNAVFAGSVPYLMLSGNLVAGWLLAKSLLIAQEKIADVNADQSFMQAKIATAHFYAQHILVQVPMLVDTILNGADSINEVLLTAF